MAEELVHCQGDSLPQLEEVEEEEKCCMIVDHSNMRSPMVTVSAAATEHEANDDDDDHHLGTDVRSTMWTDEGQNRSTVEPGSVLGLGSSTLPVPTAVDCGAHEGNDLSGKVKTSLSVEAQPSDSRSDYSDDVVQRPLVTEDDVSASRCLATVTLAADTVTGFCVLQSTDDVIRECSQSSSETSDVIEYGAHETMMSPPMYSDVDGNSPARECTHVVMTTPPDDVIPVNQGGSEEIVGLPHTDEASELLSREPSTDEDIFYEPTARKDHHPMEDETSEFSNKHTNDDAMTGYFLSVDQHETVHSEDDIHRLSLSQSHGVYPITASLQDDVAAPDAITTVNGRHIAGRGCNADDETDLIINCQLNHNIGCDDEFFDASKNAVAACSDAGLFRDGIKSQDVNVEHSDNNNNNNNNNNRSLPHSDDTLLDRLISNNAVNGCCQLLSCGEQRARSTGSCEAAGVGAVRRLLVAEDFQPVPCTGRDFIIAHQSDGAVVSQHSQAFSDFTTCQAGVEPLHHVQSDSCEDGHPDDCNADRSLPAINHHTCPEPPACSPASSDGDFAASQRVGELSESMESESFRSTAEDDSASCLTGSPVLPVYIDEQTCLEPPRLTSRSQPSSDLAAAQKVVDPPDVMGSDMEDSHLVSLTPSPMFTDQQTGLEPCSSSSESIITTSRGHADPVEHMELESSVSPEDGHPDDCIMSPILPLCNEHTCIDYPALLDKEPEAGSVVDWSAGQFGDRNGVKHASETNKDVENPSGMDVLASVCESLVHVGIDQSLLGDAKGVQGIDSDNMMILVYDDVEHLQEKPMDTVRAYDVENDTGHPEKSIKTAADDIHAPSSATLNDIYSTINIEEARDLGHTVDDATEAECCNNQAFSTVCEELDQCASEMHKEYLGEAGNCGDVARTDSDNSVDDLKKNKCILPYFTVANDQDNDDSDDEAEYETSFEEESSADPHDTTLDTKSSGNCSQQSSYNSSDVSDDVTSESDDSDSEGSQHTDDVTFFDDAREFDGIVQPGHLSNQFEGCISEKSITYCADTDALGSEIINCVQPLAEDTCLESFAKVPDNDSDENKQLKLPEELLNEAVPQKADHSELHHTFVRKLTSLEMAEDCSTEVWWHAKLPQDYSVTGENTCQFPVPCKVENDDNSDATGGEEDDFQDTESDHGELANRNVEATKASSSTDEDIAQKPATSKDCLTTEGLPALDETFKLSSEHTSEDSMAGCPFPVNQSTTVYSEDATSYLGLSHTRGAYSATAGDVADSTPFSRQMGQFPSRSFGNESEENWVATKQVRCLEKFCIRDYGSSTAEDAVFHSDKIISHEPATCKDDCTMPPHDVPFSGQMDHITNRSSGNEIELKDLDGSKRDGHVETFGVEDGVSSTAEEDEIFYTDCELDTHMAGRQSSITVVIIIQL